MRGKKKTKKPETSDLENNEEDLDDMDEKSEDEFNCCGIKHKRLDDLIAKVGFIVHLVIMLMDFYRGRWSWWLNLGSVLCYFCLIYGISGRQWYFHLPYFCLNVVLTLRTSYHGGNLDRGLWTSFVNFMTLTAFVLFIVTIHVVSILIVLLRFQLFNDYVERKKQERRQVLAEYSKLGDSAVKPGASNKSRFARHQSPVQTISNQFDVFIPNLERPIPPATHQRLQPQVKFAPYNSTYYYVPRSQQDMDPNAINPNEQTASLTRLYHPNRGRMTKSFII